MKPKNIKELQSRSRDLTVRRIGSETFVVESASHPASQHFVSVRFEDDETVFTRCTCDWAKFHGVGCAHVMAALEYLAARKGRTLSFWLTHEDAKRQKHRTFYLAGGSKDEGIWITSRNDLNGSWTKDSRFNRGNGWKSDGFNKDDGWKDDGSGKAA